MSTTTPTRPNGPRRDRRGPGGRPARGSTRRPGNTGPAAAGTRLLLWGDHAVKAALANPDRPCHRLLGTQGALDALGPAALANREGLDRRVVTGARELDQLVPPGTQHQGLVLDVGPLPRRDPADLGSDPARPSLVLALDQVSDPRNLGAILRTAAALGVEGVIVPERRSADLGGVCAKAASGALDIVPLVEVVNLARALDDLRDRGFWAVGLDAGAERRLEDLPPAPRQVLVLGAEGAGIRRLVAETCDELARLEIAPAMESLNVSVAAGIALYLLRRGATNV